MCRFIDFSVVNCYDYVVCVMPDEILYSFAEWFIALYIKHKYAISHDFYCRKSTTYFSCKAFMCVSSCPVVRIKPEHGI